MTISNENSEKSSPVTPVIVKTVYRKENIVKKIVIGFTVFIFGGFFLLLGIGFIMGMMGVKPPTINWDAVTNQIDKTLNNGEVNEPPGSELDPKE